MKRLSRWLALVFSGLVLFPSIGSTQAPYYAGKTITVIEGNSAGGVADLRTKAIMQFLQKYIPGNPTIVTQYVPGGGGRQAANHVYRAAADGLTIGAARRACSQAPCSANPVSNTTLTSLSISGRLSARTLICLRPERLSASTAWKNCAPLQGSDRRPIGGTRTVHSRTAVRLAFGRQRSAICRGLLRNRVGYSFGARGSRRASGNTGHAGADGVLPKCRRFPGHSGESQRTSSPSICPFA